MKWRGRRQSENLEDCPGMRLQAVIVGDGGAISLNGIVIGGRMLCCDQGQIQQAVEVAQRSQQQGTSQQASVEAQGYTMAERDTRRTSGQRVRSFREGLRSGDLQKARLLSGLEYEEL